MTALISLLLAGLGAGLAFHRARLLGRPHGHPWALLGAGGVVSVVANLLWAVLAPDDGAHPDAQLILAVESLVPLLFLAALYWVVRLRAPGRQVEVILDGVAVAFVPMAILWELAVQPSLDQGLPMAPEALGMAYLFLTSVMVWVVLSLWVQGPRSPTLSLITASALGFAAWAVLYVVTLGGGSVGRSPGVEMALALLTTSAGALAVVAALHPSWRGLTSEVGPQPPSMTPRRLALLGVCLASVPVGLVVGPPGPGDRLFYGVLAMETLILVGSRVADLVNDRNTAVARREAVQQRLLRQASEDPLTGLPNRTALQDALRQVLAQRRSDGAQCAVLFVDLNDFKLINDSLGHDAGDHVLRAVAQRLLGAAAPDEIVSRFGGDEFVILVPQINGPLEATGVADRYLAATAELEHVRGQDVRVRASIGVALADGRATTPGSVIRDADAAMYEAKSTEVRIVVFNEVLRTRALTQLSVEQGIRRALREDLLALRYQPLVDLYSGETIAVEALIRWHDPRGGLRGPAEFIPVAERSGLIHPLGAWVLDRACAQWRAWQDAGIEVQVGVNVAACELVRSDYVDNLVALLAQHRMPAGQLTIELTERDLLGDLDAVVVALQRLRAEGIRVAVDDFGTGYFSLTQLREVPIDILKVDRSFVSDMLHDPEARAIVRACVDLGRGLGLEVVAEGVEHPAQVRALRTMGCTIAQGYAFTMAVEAAEATRRFPLGQDADLDTQPA